MGRKYQVELIANHLGAYCAQSTSNAPSLPPTTFRRGATTMQGRPDKPLVVKCAFDTWHKRISFNSARNCTYNVLRRKVRGCAQCQGK